ncbi:MAG: L-lactate dehydrogenase complex protein LldG [Blastocatellia bacterium]
MTARDEILSKVKKALGKPDAAHDGAQAVSLPSGLAPSPPPDQTKLSPQQINLIAEQQRSELIKQFEAALLRVGGRFSVAANAQMVCERVADIAASVQAKKAVGWHSPWLQQLGLPAGFAELGIEFITDAARADKAAFINEAAAAAIGITPVDYALADSGTLCLLAKKNQPRTASLLPPVHIAVLQPRQIIRGLDDLFALLPSDSRELSSAVTLITGPSRTADIELTLVVGVHGPQQLHVILADWD